MSYDHRAQPPINMNVTFIVSTTEPHYYHLRIEHAFTGERYFSGSNDPATGDRLNTLEDVHRVIGYHLFPDNSPEAA